MKGLYYLFGILCLTYYSDSKPNGAPQDSCFYMTPRHIHPHTYRRVFPTKAMGLYNITTSADVFRPDRPIRVTLWGPPFKGFMLVAAEEGAKDWPTGIFYSDDGAGKRVSCLARGDTVTHHNNSYKDSVSVLWYGPENMMSEQIQFIATVVVNLTIYYTNIRSGMIRLDPMLHGAAAGTGGEGGAPAAVTMDPWLSGQSVTQAPANLWNNLGGRGAGGLGNTGWGANTGSNTWGTNTGGAWGSNTGSSGWGSQSASGGWGSSANNGFGTGGGAASTGNNAWGTPNNNQAGNTWGNTGSAGTSGNSWGSNTGTGTGTGTGAGTGAGAGNSWSSNGDWQQWGQGSVTSRTWIQGGDQWQNAQGGPSWNNGQTSWNAPGDGRAIWHWNSGKISSTPAPSTSQAPKAAAGNTGSAWSANNVLNLLQRLGVGGTV